MSSLRALASDGGVTTFSCDSVNILMRASAPEMLPKCLRLSGIVLLTGASTWRNLDGFGVIERVHQGHQPYQACHAVRELKRAGWRRRYARQYVMPNQRACASVAISEMSDASSSAALLRRQHSCCAFKFAMRASYQLPRIAEIERRFGRPLLKSSTAATSAAAARRGVTLARPRISTTLSRSASAAPIVINEEVIDWRARP